MDSGVGDDPKSSKTYRRQRQRLRTGRLSLLRVEARETELPRNPAEAGFFHNYSMYQVHQHWDPLKVCVVGRSYPPEFYAWIQDPKVRSLFEKIAIETEEDYQAIILKLKEFGVEILRPTIHQDFDLYLRQGKYAKPPMTPRDDMVMIGDKFFENLTFDFANQFGNIKDPSWPSVHSLEEFDQLPDHIKRECFEMHGVNTAGAMFYQDILDLVRSKGNAIYSNVSDHMNGAMVARLGRDLIVGTLNEQENTTDLRQIFQRVLPDHRITVVNTLGHSDGTYCPVCPGLIISLRDVKNYHETYPGWEVVYLPNQSWDIIHPFLQLKRKNQGKWWIPGSESDQGVIDTVENWLSHWMGFVEETVFDVNMLIIDPKNVVVFSYNHAVFEALSRYGITPHVVPFRHRYFWDGGIHCVTTDLDRAGSIKDFFPDRSCNK